VARIGIERLEQQRQQARIFGRFLLKDARGTKIERGQLLAALLHLGGERIVDTGQRPKLTIDILEADLPMGAVVQRLLEPRLIGIVLRLRGRSSLEETSGFVDLTEVELRSTVGVVQRRSEARILIGF